MRSNKVCLHQVTGRSRCGLRLLLKIQFQKNPVGQMRHRLRGFQGAVFEPMWFGYDRCAHLLCLESRLLEGVAAGH